MKELKFAIMGAGFWARYQLAAWREVGGARCIAVCDQAGEKAQEFARAWEVPAAYASAEELIKAERPDFLDIIASVEAHAPLVFLAAQYGIPVICQKPMGRTLAEAERMVAVCEASATPFFIHENWRWQRPLRRLKELLDAGAIGRPFRARITFSCSFPVFDNQPFLKTLDQFILADIGSHILDVARFLFGEAATLYCQTQRIHTDIHGEDVATVMMQMGDGVTVTCEMSYASRLEEERFPETYAVIEGERGSIALGPDYWVRVTTAHGTHAQRYAPPRYAWADPAYDLVQASIVACQQNLLAALRGENAAETTGRDNLATVRLVFAAYDSARCGEVVRLS